MKLTKQDIKTLEKMKWVNEPCISNPKIKNTPYKKLQEDFEQIDNECNRLEAKEFKLENKINKLKEEMEKDKMEQFDDYVIYLIEKYLNILEE